MHALQVPQISMGIIRFHVSAVLWALILQRQLPVFAHPASQVLLMSILTQQHPVSHAKPVHTRRLSPLGRAITSNACQDLQMMTIILLHPALRVVPVQVYQAQVQQGPALITFVRPAPRIAIAILPPPALIVLQATTLLVAQLAPAAIINASLVPLTLTIMRPHPACTARLGSMRG